MWYPVLIGLGLLLSAACSLLGFSLREFSYSRLEEICRRRNQLERFREIRQQQESALLILDFYLTISLMATFTAVAVWLGVGNGAFEANSLSHWQEIAFAAAMFVLVVFVVDVVPWVISRVSSEWILGTFWPLVSLLRQLGLPVFSVATFLDHMAHRLTGRVSPEADDAAVMSDEIRSVVDEGAREGVIESGAGQMIHRVMELQDEDVAAIMTPRTQMFCIDVESSLDEARQQLVESGHSRVPVIGESTDDILGLLYAKDLLNAFAPLKPGDPIPVLRHLLRQPVYVPVTTQIPSLLELMKRKKIHIAMVLDEYGGVAGLVTMEDILEEIVGEISDEFDEGEHLEQVQVISETVAEIDAGLHLDEVNERLHYGLPEDGEFDTIGGFLFSQLGRVPSPGEELTWEQLKFTVLTADTRRIHRLRIEVLPTDSSITEAGGEAKADD